MRLLLYASLSALVVGACANSDSLRRLTYPPDFHYLGEDELRGTMGGLAVQIRALEVVMHREDGPRLRDRERIVEILEEMQTLANHLNKGNQSNHPRIDRAAPALKRKIDRALFGARRNPPNYYFAGAVSGACRYCHTPRHKADSGTENRSAQHTAVHAGPETR